MLDISTPQATTIVGLPQTVIGPTCSPEAGMTAVIGRESGHNVPLVWHLIGGYKQTRVPERRKKQIDLIR